LTRVNLYRVRYNELQSKLYGHFGPYKLDLSQHMHYSCHNSKRLPREPIKYSLQSLTDTSLYEEVQLSPNNQTSVLFGGTNILRICYFSKLTNNNLSFTTFNAFAVCKARESYYF
jgi:hypothetical protein